MRISAVSALILALATAASAQASAPIAEGWSGRYCYRLSPQAPQVSVTPPSQVCIESLSWRADILSGQVKLQVQGSPVLTREVSYRVQSGQTSVEATVWSYVQKSDSCGAYVSSRLQLVVAIDPNGNIVAPVSLTGRFLSMYDQCHSEEQPVDLPYEIVR